MLTKYKIKDTNLYIYNKWKVSRKGNCTDDSKFIIIYTSVNIV